MFNVKMYFFKYIFDEVESFSLKTIEVSVFLEHQQGVR